MQGIGESRQQQHGRMARTIVGLQGFISRFTNFIGEDMEMVWQDCRKFAIALLSLTKHIYFVYENMHLSIVAYMKSYIGLSLFIVKKL